MIQAIGVMFICQGKVLLLKRSDQGDMAGYWALPGGKVEDGESLGRALARECQEEIGYFPPGGRVEPLDRQVTGELEYLTYTMSQPGEPFIPELNEEHTDYIWALLDQYPDPLHPGVAVSLKKLTMDELAVAEAIRDGALPSPSRFHNVSLFAMRISGTGIAYRAQHKEYVFRDPADYLTDRFLRRCNGLLIVAEHPDKSSLDSQEFQDRVVGTTMLSYIKGDEVWGIAKCYDDAMVDMLTNNQLSTSPTVVFSTQALNTKVALEDGSTLLIEGKPSLLDHLAVCEQGVWDKGQPPSGVLLTSGEIEMPTEDEKMAALRAKDDAVKADKATADAMVKKDADEQERMEKERDDKAKADKAKADAAKANGDDEGKGGDDEEGKLEKAIGMLSDISTRMDSIEKSDKARADAAKARADALDVDGDKHKDEEDAALSKNNEDAKKAQLAKADADAKDAWEKEKADRAKSDADTRQKIADLEAKMPKEMTDADVAKMADAQAKADSVYQAHGTSAPRPLNGETLPNYRRRLLSRFRDHSPAWKTVDIGSLPLAVLDVAEPQIYGDAMTAAINPTDLGAGELRQRTRVDDTGRRITEFSGKPDAWLGQFKLTPRRMTGINKERA